MPATRSHRWTADEVRALMERTPGHWPRYELIDGALLVAAAPAMLHYRAVIWLWQHLYEYTLREGAGEACMAPADLALRPETISQPDVFVAPREQVRTFTRWQDVTGVVLCVEVLSPSTAHDDRGRKRIHYQQAGIDEYWIVDPHLRHVERWRPSSVQPDILRSRLTWRPDGARTVLTMDLDDLFTTAHGE